jgi:hypothetical protein
LDCPDSFICLAYGGQHCVAEYFAGDFFAGASCLPSAGITLDVPQRQ